MKKRYVTRGQVQKKPEAETNFVRSIIRGDGMEGEIAWSRTCGFADHLTKPINIKSLDRTIIAVSANRV